MKNAIVVFLSGASYEAKLARLSVCVRTAQREEQDGVYDSVAHAWVEALEANLGLV